MRKEPWEFITNAMLGTADPKKRGGRMLVVTGMAGCGKTQIVLKFMQEHEAE
jgi:DNA transposition AAA+ family ATPase